MSSDDQSAVSKISLVVTLAPTAVEHDAPLTDHECALNIEMSIPASAMKVLSHLAIVLLDTGVCCPTYDRNS